MKASIPEKLKMFAEELGGRLYVVGGACRNSIAGLDCAVTDWDICAPVSAESAVAAAKKCGIAAVAVYPRTGTVRFASGGDRFEFASFRTDNYVRGEHTPSSVVFTEDISLDAVRRDFRCNAVYYDISADQFVDPLGGIADIAAKRLTTVAPADRVFGEDGLRLMRLCRFAAELGFTPDEECLSGARNNAALIRDISCERIYSELCAILVADVKYGISGGQYYGLTLMKRTGVLKEILPELALGDGMSQRADYHDYDVLEHSLRTVLYAPVGIRMAALLHDVGKPAVMLSEGRFARHEEEGEKIAADILKRLRAPNAEIKRVCALVRWHMYDFACLARPNKVRKFIAFHGDILADLLSLKQADYSACKDDTGKAPSVARWEKIYAQMRAEGAPLSQRQLKVRGDELIAAGVAPAEVSATLDYLLGECAINPALNEREKLVRLAVSRKCH